MFGYRQIKSLPEDYVKSKVAEYLAEDAPLGDRTAMSIFPDNHKSRCVIKTRESCVFSGEDVLRFGFGGECTVDIDARDGEHLRAGSGIAIVEGPTLELLLRERTILNLLQRLSGIATKTNSFVALAKKHNVGILDTRKTIPGMRLFEKYAVQCGGGVNHRYNLSEGIMIKDNHIAAAGGIIEAVKMIREKFPDMKIEVEVDRYDQLSEAIEAGADGFLLDNMKRDETLRSVELIRNSERGHELVIESSGGINMETIENYLDTGIDYISLGAITHSAPNIDIHMEVL